MVVYYRYGRYRTYRYLTCFYYVTKACPSCTSAIAIQRTLDRIWAIAYGSLGNYFVASCNNYKLHAPSRLSGLWVGKHASCDKYSVKILAEKCRQRREYHCKKKKKSIISRYTLVMMRAIRIDYKYHNGTTCIGLGVYPNLHQQPTNHTEAKI